MATIRQCKSRLITLLKIVDFFEENPFEQSFCGMSRRDALCLVQFYLKEQGKDISVLANLDFAQHVGKKFRDAYGNFGAYLKMTRTALAEGIDAIDNLPQTAQPNLPLSQTLSQSSVPLELPGIVQKFQEHVLDVTGDSVPDPTKNEARRQWGPAVIERGLPLRDKWNKNKVVVNQTYADPQNGQTKTRQVTIKNEDLVAGSFSRILDQQLAVEREAERVARFNQQKTHFAGQAVTAAQNFAQASGQTLNQQQLADLEKVFTDVVDQPVFDQQTKTTTKEAELWENFILKHPDAATKTQDDFSQAKRETEVRNHYINELVKSGVDKIVAEEIINQIGARDLTEVSFLKYFRHLSTDPSLSPEGQQEKIGGLLAGKMLSAAHQAVNAPGFDPAKKGQLVSEAVLETYTELANQGFSFLQAPDSVISQKLNEKLQKKFASRAIIRGQNVTIATPILGSEVTLEAKELVSRQTAAVALGETGYHTLPIPGLVFLNEHQRIEIIANKNLLEVLKTNGKFDDVLLKFKDQRINQINDQLANAQKYKLTPNDITWLLQRKTQLENTPSLITLQENLLHSLGIHPLNDKKGFSPEELAFATKYVEMWHNMLQTHGFWGGIINKIAVIHSLQNSAIDNAIWGQKQYGQVATFFRGMFMMPNIMAYQYIKVFLSAATQDFTTVPYYASVLFKSFIVGSVSLWVKTNITRIVDKFIPSKLRGIFYVKDSHGMTHLTLLHPIETAKVVWTKFWRGRVQALANSALQWGARILGKPILATFMGGPIGAALGAFWLIWDFLIPDWVKKALKFLLVGLTIGLLWLLQFLIGWGGVIGGLLGFLFPVLGPLTPIVGTLIGMGVGSLWYFLTGSTALAPGWVVSLFPHATGVGAAIGNFIGGVGNILGFGTGHALAAQAGTAAAVAAAVPVAASVSGALVGITFLWTASWVPATPQAVPGGLVATSFKVEKSVTPINTSNCPEFSPGKKCKNAVTSDAGAEFEYTVTIQSAPGKTINNIQIKDKVTILALGQCGLNIEDTCPKGTKVNKYEVTPLVPDTSAITIPDASGKNAVEIKYRIKLNDSKYRNSAVMNLVEVTANGERATNGSIFTIGTPPPSDCPVKLGQISCASLGSTTHPNVGCQHGSNKYWCDLANGSLSAQNPPAPMTQEEIASCQKGESGRWSTYTCTYAIPYLVGTMGNSSICSNKTPLAADYGFAADIVPGVSDMVFFPSIFGEDLNWKRYGNIVSNNGGAWGYSAYYEASGADFSYKMYVTHIRKSDISDGGQSGTQLGTMCDKNRKDSSGNPECSIDKHVHIELVQIAHLGGGQTTLRPEILCSY